MCVFCALRVAVPSKSITGAGSALGGEDVSGMGAAAEAVAGGGGGAGEVGDVNESKQSNRQRQKQGGIELL